MWAEDFGAVGDGTTDDTAALTSFWNHAIANPGVPHRLRAKRYRIVAALPRITVSNVWIEGAGAEIHDVGILLSGTVIAWGGPISPTTNVCAISAVPGATNQRVANITFKGIGIDCNSGAAGCGLDVRSVRNSTVDVAVTNASVAGVNIGVLPSHDGASPLGESSDTQRNFIRVLGRQIEAPAGHVLVVGGSAIANTSFNKFEVDCQHMNVSAIYCTNSDNNDWALVRCHKPATGSASESVALLGSDVASTRVRAERFHALSATVPLHAYGTGGSSAFTFGSVDHTVFSFDAENGTPQPIVDPGASVHWRFDKSALSDDSWRSYSPTITALSGTLGGVGNIVGSYRKMGKVVEFKIQFRILANGTGGTALVATLPLQSAPALSGDTCTGTERALSGKACSGFIEAGANSISIRSFDGAYPGASGAVLTMSGTYQCES